MKTKGYYAYIRTSTVKQGTEGVSLEVQRNEAERLARQKGVEITRVFSEMETAAKQGRPIFLRMMKELRAGEADGLILHKIDRGARNLREWSDITDLIELGVTVHFVHDSLDLTTRGGRLTGDMLAAVAADYIRNLREETKKGILGRLKQGIWPFGAPLGYVNNGKAKAKSINPVTGPLIKQAFELYATGQYNLKSLRLKLHTLGLRTGTGNPMSKNTLTAVFNNPFYFGLLILRSTGEAFPGTHEPLISKALFDHVQRVLRGGTWRKSLKHEFAYRGEIVCASCGFRLIGETHKGYNYYRCHGNKCSGTSFREERVDERVREDLEHLSWFVHTYPGLEANLKEAIAIRRQDREGALQALLLTRRKFDARLSSATDAVIDGLIDRETFAKKKREMLEARSKIEESIARHERGELPLASHAEYYLELAERLRRKVFHESARTAREITRSLTSNFGATGKTVALQWNYAFDKALDHAKQNGCALAQDKPRTEAHFFKLFMGHEYVPTSPHTRRRSVRDRTRKDTHTAQVSAPVTARSASGGRA